MVVEYKDGTFGTIENTSDLLDSLVKRQDMTGILAVHFGTVAELEAKLEAKRQETNDSVLREKLDKLERKLSSVNRQIERVAKEFPDSGDGRIKNG